jgi:2-dehydropantoate 2-reductase
MRIAVIGAGGTGGYFGGLLALTGEQVTIVARGASLDAIRSAGLTIHSDTGGTFVVTVPVTGDPRTIGEADLVLFCVKSYATAEAAELLPPLIGAETSVLSVQNGIDSAERIGRVIGQAPMLGAIAHVSAVVKSPGVIVQTGTLRRIVVGEFDGRDTPRARRIVETLRRAGIDSEMRPDIQVALWEKFIFICAMSGVTAMTRLPIGRIMACPESRTLMRGTLAEVEAVAHARGIAVASDYGDRMLAYMEGLHPAIRGSMAHDLAVGGRLELSTLNGTVVRLGKAHGIPTPLNGAIYAVLRPYEDRSIAPA